MALRQLLTLLLIASVAAVAGCGRRGPLETPTQAAYEQDREEARKAGLPVPPKPSEKTPDRRFILDRLID